MEKELNISDILKDVDDFENEESIMMTEEELNIYNNNQVLASINMIGNRTILALIALLVAYIRHAVVNNAKTKIEVDICTTVANPAFTFDVNGRLIEDLVTKPKILIN